MKCKICGKTEYEINTKNFPIDFCSYSCYEEWVKFNKTPNCKCNVCEKEMYIKQSRLSKIKNGITCSKECSNKLKSEYMKEYGNHQYGLIGELNTSSKEYVKYNQKGYLLEYCQGHPYPNDRRSKCERVLQHRLIIERNYLQFDEIYFENINNWIVLKPEYDVHHINEIKDDNRLENLKILTKSEHTTLHNNLLNNKANKYTSILGVFKQGELLETPEVDNQQPSLNGNILEGSTTNNRVQFTLDSNVDTSALLQQILNIIGDDIVWTASITKENADFENKESQR